MEPQMTLDLETAQKDNQPERWHGALQGPSHALTLSAAFPMLRGAGLNHDHRAPACLWQGLFLAGKK